MSSTFKELPKEAAEEMEISSASPAIAVNQIGNHVSIGFDSTGVVADKAARVVNFFNAGETISALQVVYENNGYIYKTSNDTLDHANAVGIALTSGIAGDEIMILQYGLLEDPSFNFTSADLIFVAASGSISTTAPSSGYLTRLGRAINTHTALIIIDSPKTL